MLSTKNVSKKFGDLTAVDDISWDVSEGETKAIIGPNGAGKTTYFNLLSGVLTPDTGTIMYDGTDITGLPLHKRAQLGIAKTYQITNIFNEFDPLSNIRIAAQRQVPLRRRYAVHVSSASQTDIDERARAVLERLGIGDLGVETAGNLSHGDKRKLEIGIGLATDPDVLLLDEPTAGMAADERREVVALLSRLGDEQNLTMVIVEHNIDVVFELASTVTVLHNGRIIQEGPPSEISEDERVREVYLGGA